MRGLAISVSLVLPSVHRNVVTRFASFDGVAALTSCDGREQAVLKFLRQRGGSWGSPRSRPSACDCRSTRRLSVPSAPGLGAEIDDDAVTRYRLA
jgi:hypothetical protein